MRVVFCIFSAELLLIVGYRVSISTRAVGGVLKHVQLLSPVLSAAVFTVFCGLKLWQISN